MNLRHGALISSPLSPLKEGSESNHIIEIKDRFENISTIKRDNVVSSIAVTLEDIDELS